MAAQDFCNRILPENLALRILLTTVVSRVLHTCAFGFSKTTVRPRVGTPRGEEGFPLSSLLLEGECDKTEKETRGKFGFLEEGEKKGKFIVLHAYYG